MSQNSPVTAEPFQLDPDSTWIAAVELFQKEASAWLTPADAPQLMALRSIAKELDDGKFQAALISQFTLIHRTLREKGDPARGSKQKPNPANDDDALLEMFQNNPAAMWRGDT